MKENRTTIKIVLILSIIFVLLLWPITFLSLNSDVWLLIQKRNDVALPEEEIKVDNQQIVSFFKEKANDLSFLTEQEMLHMYDVKSLITKNNLLFSISLSSFLLMLTYLENTKTVIRKISFFVLLLLILLFVMDSLGFTDFFLGFHKILFSGNYLFSETSMLKILYPDGFFRDIFIVYFILSIAGCLTVLSSSYKLKVLKIESNLKDRGS